MGFKVQNPMNVQCDNKTTISIANNPIQNNQTKHIEGDYYIIKEIKVKFNLSICKDGATTRRCFYQRCKQSQTIENFMHQLEGVFFLNMDKNEFIEKKMNKNRKRTTANHQRGEKQQKPTKKYKILLRKKKYHSDSS